MKKSTSLILLTILVVIGCLITYNLKLKAAYDAKSYRNPYNGMEFTPFLGVKKLYLKSTYETQIRIEQGDKEGMWIDTLVKDSIRFSVSGDRLDFDFKGVKNRYYKKSIIFMVKTITDLDVAYNEYKVGEAYSQGQVYVKEFNLNKLNLQLSGGVAVLIVEAKIDTLNAVVGQKKGYSTLKLSPGTKVNLANYNVGVEGELSLSNTKVSINNNGDSSKNAIAQK